MSTKHALLGLLLEGPSYPYQLADRLKERVGPAWSVGSGQIYNTIRQMEADGLIEPVGSNMTGHDKRRRFFSITDGGEREFEGWLEAISGAVRLHRRPELLKITLAGPERLSTALRHIDAYEESCTMRLNEFREARDLIPRQRTRVRADHVLLRLNLSIDISVLEGELQHAREARETLLWLHAQPNAIWPSNGEQSGPQEAPGWQDARKEIFEGWPQRNPSERSKS
jgi:DNA-binding PadR family transcriptional regulator